MGKSLVSCFLKHSVDPLWLGDAAETTTFPNMHFASSRMTQFPLAKTRSSAIAEGPRDASCQLKSCQLPRNSVRKLLVRQVLNKSKL